MSVEKFDFTMMLQQGHNAAEQVLMNNNEIEEVLSGLHNSLKNYLALPIEFHEIIEYEDEGHGRENIFTPFSLRVKTGRTKIKIHHKETDTSETLFFLRRSEDGYPITAILGKDNFMCNNQDEFYSSVSNIIATPQINFQLRKFKREAESKIKPQS